MSIHQSKYNTSLNNLYPMSTSNRSLAIKSFPSVLPYRVIEELRASNLLLKNIAARISKCGWAWFVTGRRLFVWRYLNDCTGSKPKASKCYELLLPPSDISHKAELICVLTTCARSNVSRFPSVLAVSPEGSIRFWPNISQENTIIDLVVTADLAGQECQILLDVHPLGCILGTTTNSLVHICINHQDPEHSPLICRTLKPPQGLFSGIGKKFSSFIFGSMPTAQYSAESRQLIRIVRNEPIDGEDQVLRVYILVLYNCCIQKWLIEDFDSESFYGEINLEKSLKEVFINKFYNRATTHHNQISIWIIDLALNRFEEILLLTMCTNSDIPNESNFALITLAPESFSDGSTTDPSTGALIKTFQHLNGVTLNGGAEFFMQRNQTSAAASTTSTQNRTFNLILDNSRLDCTPCYIYNSTKLFWINYDIIDQDGENSPRTGAIEEIDFQVFNDYLLGAIVYDRMLLLLTFKNGFVSCHSNISDSNHSKQLCSSDQQLVDTVQGDKCTILKRALRLFIKGEKTRAELLVQETFPFIKSVETKQNQFLATSALELDETVCAVSVDICDHVPHADPRWSNFIQAENPSPVWYDESRGDENPIGSASVIITNQLEEKLSIHNVFIELLKRTRAWDALGSLTTVNSILPTKLILCEHTEKLIACLALRKLPERYGQVIETAIKKVLENRKLDPRLEKNGHLTSQDLFYREVTKMDELFWKLVEMEETQLNFDRARMDQNLIIMVTDIITSVFAEVCLYRQANGTLYHSAVVADCDYLPWSTVKHVSGIRDTWLQQFDLLIKCFGGIDALTDDPERWTLIGQKLADLADIILDSFTVQLRCLSRQNEKYATIKRGFEITRYKCLEALLKIKQYDKAAALAEKYEDFDILIKLCDELNDQDQLRQYTRRFEDKGFSEYLFQWYLKEGKQGKMLSSSVLSSSIGGNYKFDEFLANHEALKWIHQLHMKKFKEASLTLKNLSNLEDSNPARKKTMLSIGKLALIASGDTNYKDFDLQIRLLNYQTELPDSLLRQNNLERKKMKVLTAKQLADILISSNDGMEEDLRNFHKALEVADLVADCGAEDLYRQIQLKIWRQAFQKDDWNEYGTDNQELFIRRSFFYQLASSYYGDEPKNLPEVDRLVDGFNYVQNNQKASYFLRATYEMLGVSH